MTLEVLSVITSTSRRGAERFATALAPELTERGCRTRVVALVDGATDNPLPVDVLGRRRLAPQTLRALRDAARGCDVLIANGSSTLPACALALAGTGVPFIYRSIGDPNFWGATTKARVQTGLLLRRADHVVSLGPEARARLHRRYRYPLTRITPIPRGFSTIEFPRVDVAGRRVAREALAIGAETPVAVWVGSISSEKDLPMAIRAVGSLNDWILVVVGDGPDRNECEAIAAAVAPGRVRFLGQHPTPAPVIAAADLLVLSSRTEGLPGVVVEASLSGIPSVTTAVGFVDELVDDSTGRIVPVGDVSAMVDALAVVFDDREALGEAAHQRAIEHFSLETSADRWSALLIATATG